MRPWPVSRAEKKPIFFNCFADWAIPCHGMNKYVFSDAEFADYMNRNFVNLYIDVSKRANAAVAKRYDIRRFAHFLVLDADGNILLRIVGGKKLPEFKEDVMRALSPKTSLPGLEAAYKKGKRDKKTLLAYLYDLNLADDKEQFDKVAQEYVATLKPKDYAKSENWFVVSKLITDRESLLYKNLLDNKEEFVKNNGQKVNDFVESLFYAEAAGYAAGSTPYNADAVLGLQIDARRANVPDTSVVYVACKLAQLRGEKRIAELLDYMRAKGDAFRYDRPSYELTFDFPDMTAEQTKQVVAYLREAATRNPGEAGKTTRVPRRSTREARRSELRAALAQRCTGQSRQGRQTGLRGLLHQLVWPLQETRARSLPPTRSGQSAQCPFRQSPNRYGKGRRTGRVQTIRHQFLPHHAHPQPRRHQSRQHRGLLSHRTPAR